MFIVAGNPTIDYVNGVRRPGGFAFYASIALRLIDENVSIIGCIGSDYPLEYLSILKRLGIDLSYLRTCSTSTVFRLEYYDDYRILRLDSQGERIQLNGYALDGKHNPTAILLGPVASELGVEDIVYARKISDKVVVEAQGFIRRFTRMGEIVYEWTSDFIEALRGVMLVHVSEDEARALGDIEEAVLYLSKHARIVALTMSFKGSLVGYNNSLYHVGVPKVYAGDPTGAGDTYTAVFTSYLLRRRDPVEAAKYATVAAGLKIHRSTYTLKWFSRIELEEHVGAVEVERIY